MFKNLIVYRINPEWGYPQLVTFPPFHPCGTTQYQAVGFVPPRGLEHGSLAETVGGHHILLRLQFERRQVPAEVLKRRVEEMAAAVERDTGRKPGKRERADLKVAAELELLPHAFARRSAVSVWLDTSLGLVCLDASNAKQADEALSLLVRHLDGFSPRPLHTTRSPAQAMADWLLADEPEGFTVDRECELRSADEMKSVVRYARHPLDIEEVREHIAQGKRPTRLALTWQGRVSFVLTEAGALKKLDFLDGVFEGRGEDEFDADAAITTGELCRLLPDLIEALGGEVHL